MIFSACVGHFSLSCWRRNTKIVILRRQVGIIPEKLFYPLFYLFCTVNHKFSESPGVLNKEVSKFAKIKTPRQVFFCDFCNFFRSNFFIKNFRWLLQNFNLKELVSSKLFKGINPDISFFCDAIGG